MKIIIPSYNRYSDNLFTTYKFFSRDYRQNIILLVEESQYKEYEALDTGCVIVSMPKKEMRANWNMWAHDWKWNNVMEAGERYIFMDDNILWFTRFDDSVYLWAEVAGRSAEIEITWEEFVEKMKEDIAFASRLWLNMTWTANINNPYFRKNKYSTSVMCQHKCCAVRKVDEYGYDLWVRIREEYDMSAYHIVRDWGVLRNNFLFAKRKHFMKWWIGNYEQRLDWYRSDFDYLRKKYPWMIKANNTKSWVKYRNTEIKICTWYNRVKIINNLIKNFWYKEKQFYVQHSLIYQTTPTWTNQVSTILTEWKL